jgi:hypothetical protein
VVGDDPDICGLTGGFTRTSADFQASNERWPGEQAVAVQDAIAIRITGDGVLRIERVTVAIRAKTIKQ